jgi:mannosyltransferase
MCGFFASKIFDLPRLANVTYYMRLDTDSYIFRPLCYDPVARFHERNLTYAYRSGTTDPEWVTHGMWALVDEYARANPDVDATMRMNKWWWPEGSNRDHEKMLMADFPTYYNNFEIVKLEAFRRPDVRRWLDEVMSVPERVYKYRWGERIISPVQCPSTEVC